MSPALRGINYDVGTRYDAGNGPGRLSTHRYDIDGHLRRDMDVIAAELQCNAVQLDGTDVDRLMVAASLALERGLSPWIQPRLIGATPADHLDHLRHVARAAEWLRRRFDRVTLSVGAELSLFMSGIVEGGTVADRMEQLLAKASAPSSVAEDLNEHLRAAEAAARAQFGGPLTYGAGPWERVNWRDMFDLVGLEVYLRPIDATSIVCHLQAFQHFDKPVVATEFGCVTNKLGAHEYGADVVDWTTIPPRIIGSTIRDEKIQAQSLAPISSPLTPPPSMVRSASCSSNPPTSTTPHLVSTSTWHRSASLPLSRSTTRPYRPDRSGGSANRPCHELAKLYAGH